MSDKIGFIDESGDKSIHFTKDGVSTFFIVTAIILDEYSVDTTREQFVEIAAKHTRAPEIKSSAKAFKDFDKRIEFIKDISKLNFKIYSIIVDKREVFEDSGLQFRNTFYKYVNGLLDRELYDYYPYLKLISDNHGSEKFMDGFVDYVEKNHNQTELFRGPMFEFCDSKDEPLIQLADFIAGSLSRCYDPKKFNPRSPEILKILDKHILHLREWPENPRNKYSNIELEDEKFNKELVDFIFFKIKNFIHINSDNPAIEIKNQLICLNYLVYRFKKDPHEYIYSDEIIDRIRVRNIHITKRIFSKEVIGNLRENKILITSSQSGYKIPCCRGDIIRFYNNYSSKVIPMIETLKKTDIVIKSATSGKINLLEELDFDYIKRLTDIKK
ncbi:DUF3800 domain-containing protein [Maribacter dokdonensis]|uniref:DUF3800 domain-containing protein n=1 Tax=Maribacter dokdonensis TaxID=320912 RepID=UPI00071990C0|nr:DUF3800 domain-containing protein [Maribacter dokdonensis]KSA14768.1 PF12686 family protein [Maribacter dokdonensis DSW-8]